MDGETQPNGLPTSGMNIPLVKFSDMPEEMRTDSVETVSTAIETALEKHPQNYENAAKAVKTSMDKKYGKSWHCIIGEGYGFSINYEVKNLLYMYFNGNLAILVFKGMSRFVLLDLCTHSLLHTSAAK